MDSFQGPLHPATHFGLISLLPAVVALGLAIKTRRVIGPLLVGILSGVIVLDAAAQGWGHSVLFSLVNLFGAIAGHPANEQQGVQGVGMLKDAGRPAVIFIVMLLGAFMTVLQRSGGAFALGEWLSGKVGNRQSAQNAAGIMGCALFTSSYFSCLATGMVGRGLFDRIGISRAKLAFIIDSTSAPVMALVPISGWVAYMSALIGENISHLNDGFRGLLLTIPFNFYSIIILVFLFLIANGRIRDYGAMRSAEESDPCGEAGGFSANTETESALETKGGRVLDMIIPLGIATAFVAASGLWNYVFADLFEGEKLPLNGYQMLIVGFSLGIIAAFVRYTITGLMAPAEFLDAALDGTKEYIVGAIIIVLALTLGDLLRVPAPEALGAGEYLESIARNLIPHTIVPFSVFVLSAFMAFFMGTSWGVWAIMMPIAIPLTLGGNPYLVAAAVFSGGTFGDHSSPISDTTVMSSLGAGCDHMIHVNTQLPYALTAASVSAVLFLVAGFVF